MYMHTLQTVCIYTHENTQVRIHKDIFGTTHICYDYLDCKTSFCHVRITVRTKQMDTQRHVLCMYNNVYTLYYYITYIYMYAFLMIWIILENKQKKKHMHSV